MHIEFPHTKSSYPVCCVDRMLLSTIAVLLFVLLVACEALNLPRTTKIRQHVKVSLSALQSASSDIVNRQMMSELGVSRSMVDDASRKLMGDFYELDMKTKGRLDQILRLYERERIDASAFHGVDGYGHGDLGREKLDLIVADLMGAEAALVRLQVSIRYVTFFFESIFK